MWIFTKHGVLSIVQDRKNDTLRHVRSREKETIEHVLGIAEDICEALDRGQCPTLLFNPKADYHYRAIMDDDLVDLVVLELLRGIHYGDFKSSVTDQYRKRIYTGIWSQAAHLQSRPDRAGLAAGVRFEDQYCADDYA